MLKTTRQLAQEGRSRITNGRELLPDIDGRSVWARRMRDVWVNHISDIGGHDLITEAERSILRRAAVLTTELEYLEQKFALNGGASDKQLLLYSTVANTLRRLLGAVGIERRSKDITPNLQEYMGSVVTDQPSDVQGGPPEAQGRSVDRLPPTPQAACSTGAQT